MRRTLGGEAVLAALAAGALYARTLAPGVGAGDSGELLLAAETWGVPHPPGYPLWTLLARAAAALPLGTLAWRVNALSALLAAIAVGLLYHLARRLGAGRAGAAAASSLFALSLPLWRVAVEAEVYTLAVVAFLVLALAAWNARAARSAGGRADALYFLAAGLSFLTHQTLAAPAILLGAWVVARRFTWARVARAAGWTLLGLSPSLVVAWRAVDRSAFLWKERAPLQALAEVFTREAYGGLMQNPWRLDLVVEAWIGMARSVAAGVGPAAFLLALFALAAAVSRPLRNVAGRTRASRLLRLLAPLAVAAGSIPFALAALLVFTPDAEHFAQVEPFLLPVVAVLALAAGVGAGVVVRAARAARTTRAAHRGRPAASLATAASARGVLAVAGVAAAILLTGAAHFGSADRSGFTLPERYGRDLLASTPPGATLVVDGDNETFLAAYLTRREGLRPDLSLVHRRGCVFGDANGLASRPRAEWARAARDADLRRIAESDRVVAFASAPTDLMLAGVRFASAGLVSLACPPGSAMPAAWSPPAAWPRSTALLSGKPRHYDFVTRKLAISYSDAAARELLIRGDFETALSWFEDAAAVGFDMPEAQWNLSVAAAAAGRPERALDALLSARTLAPRSAESASRLALFLSAAGQHADAARWFERAYRDAPSAELAEDVSRAWGLAGDDARARAWSVRRLG